MINREGEPSILAFCALQCCLLDRLFIEFHKQQNVFINFMFFVFYFFWFYYLFDDGKQLANLKMEILNGIFI